MRVNRPSFALRPWFVIIGVLCLLQGASGAEKTITIEGVRPGTDSAYNMGSFYYLPFDVPDGVYRMTIRRDLAVEPDGNVGLCTYLFDPRAGELNRRYTPMNTDSEGTSEEDRKAGVGDAGGVISSTQTKNGPSGFGFRASDFEFPSRGFRGLVEMGADPIVITGDHATTTKQFYHGPIQPGRWHIAQHFRWKNKQVTGVRYKYTITFSFGERLNTDEQDGQDEKMRKGDPESPFLPLSLSPFLPSKPGWYCADLHTHTNHSDGQGTMMESAAHHAAFGYDIVNNTDHNVTTAQFDLPDAAAKYPHMLFLCGEEVSTLSGHANVIGAPLGDWYDPRMIPGDGRLPKLIEKVHRDGALFSINHAFATGALGWSFPKEEWATADAMEVFQGNWHTADDRQATAMWDGLLKDGRHITGVGGSDTHAKEGNISNFTWIWAESLSREAVVDGIRKGHVFVSLKKTGPLPYLSVPGTSALPGDTVRIGTAETVPVQVRIVGGKGMFLRIVWQDGEAKVPIEKEIARITQVVPVRPSLARSYARAEVQRADGTVFALTNPIWFER